MISFFCILSALLRLSPDKRLERLSPVCLPDGHEEEEEEFLGVRCLTSGWGQVRFGGDLMAELRQVRTQNAVCITTFYVY